MDRKPITVRGWIRRIWVTAGLLFTGWLAWNLQAHGVPASAYASDAAIEVVASPDYTLFLPRATAGPPTRAVAFLPGGLVDPDAYAPVVRELAARGLRAALVTLPFRSAITAGMRDQLRARITAASAYMGADLRLVLAGHSRGAALAASFAADGLEIDGLVLIGTTHPRDHDLSQARYPVLRILGTRDCVASVAGARANAHNLPRHTKVLEIAGANHAQFGFYGSQINDCSAEISRAEQQRQLIDAIVQFAK